MCEYLPKVTRTGMEDGVFSDSRASLFQQARLYLWSVRNNAQSGRTTQLVLQRRWKRGWGQGIIIIVSDVGPKSSKTFSRPQNKMICPAGTREGVGDGERPFPDAHLHPRGWASAPGSPARLQPSHLALWLSSTPQSRGSDPWSSISHPSPGSRLRCRSRPRRAVPEAWALSAPGLPRALPGNRAVRPAAGPWAARSPTSGLPAPTPRGHLRSAAAARSRSALGLGWPRPALAGACGPAPDRQTPPRARPLGPAPSSASPSRCRKITWGEGGAPEEPLSPSLLLGCAPRTLRLTQTLPPRLLLPASTPGGSWKTPQIGSPHPH